MKNALKVVIFTVLFLAIAAGGVFGFFKFNKTDFTIDDGAENNTVVIKSYNGSSVNIDIPQKIRGKKVVSIDEDAFKGTDIKSVIVPEGVKRIEQAAFKDCAKLETVTLNEDIEYIGENAFANCDKLAEITLPASVKEIGDTPFGDCDNLKTINTADGGGFFFDNGVLYSADKTTAYFALKGTDLSDYEFPAELKNFSAFFFFGHEEIKSIKLPDGMTAIEKDLFALCKNLKDVEIPEGVKSIGNSAFLGCGSLEKLYIPKSVRDFEKYCFPIAAKNNNDTDNKNYEDMFSKNFTLIVEKKSPAYFYAVENNIKYEFAK